MNDLKITYNDNKTVKEVYDGNIEVKEPFITVPSSVWKQFALIDHKYLRVIDGNVEIEDSTFLLIKKDTKFNELATTYQIESTKPVSYKEVLYKGGDASASAIAGAVQLAQSLGEPNVKIIASDDSANEMSFDEALELSGLIAKAWRTAFFRYKELKLQISNAATVEELDLISWEEV